MARGSQGLAPRWWGRGGGVKPLVGKQTLPRVLRTKWSHCDTEIVWSLAWWDDKLKFNIWFFFQCLFSVIVISTSLVFFTSGRKIQRKQLFPTTCGKTRDHPWTNHFVQVNFVCFHWCTTDTSLPRNDCSPHRVWRRAPLPNKNSLGERRTQRAEASQLKPKQKTCMHAIVDSTFTYVSIYLSIYLSIQLSLSLFLSLKPQKSQHVNVFFDSHLTIKSCLMREGR